METQWHLYVMAVLYILAGINHFINPTFYLRIIPPVLKYKQLINSISGAAEILLGILLLTSYRPMAAIGVIALLIAIFPANVYHLIQKGAGMKVPIWGLWLRLPAQGLLIWWAWQYV
ncbi:DoxX family protein [Imperialibacter roseus]|uniref:DoxX family protein n=1 Tax=Imperialibacter roseus TaxID=1324217 RepID=A0ABZ0IVZ3_9BACT|nr:DoxX family protein [Imperialibacter roseus]WOK08956.1 DoxX family protein [Imperialibacter roseus]